MTRRLYTRHRLSCESGDQPQTRVLILEPGRWEDEITCTLKVVNMTGSSDLGFEAISYVWGDRTKSTGHIRVDNNTFDIGVNLEAALRSFRNQTAPKALWVDAVCINQTDIQERNQQVASMRDIYHRCEKVLIWLGPDAAPAYQAPCRWKTDFSQAPHNVLLHPEDEDRINRFVARYKRYYELPFALRYHLRIDSIMGAYSLLTLLAQNKCINLKNFPFLAEEASHNIFQVLSDITSSSWWSRIWVVQELVLATRADVYYHNFISSWDLYVHAARNYNAHRGTCCKDHYKWLQPYNIRLLEAFMRAVLEIETLRHQWQLSVRKSDTGGQDAQICLRQLLWRFRNRVSSEPRDQIYALLSLVTSWGDQRDMYVDYRVDLPTLYQVTAQRTMNADKSLLILAGVTSKQEGRHFLPSWVPDWTTRPSSRHESERLQRIGLFDACNGEKMEVPVRVVDQSFLGLLGRNVDKISDVSEVMIYDEKNFDRSLATFDSWYRFVVRDQAMTAKYRAAKMEAYWRTLCMDTVRKNSDVGNDLAQGYHYERCSSDYIKHSRDMWMDAEMMPKAAPESSQHLENRSNDNPHRQAPDYIEVDFSICSATMNRKLFITQQGFLGLGPSETRCGDSVFIFAGGHTPFLLREAQDRVIVEEKPSKTFELVGDCYVHGAMDGKYVPKGWARDQQELTWLI